MRKPRVSKGRKKSSDELELEKDFEGVDIESLEPVEISLDPKLREKVRSTDRLVQLTLRVGADQIEEAKRVAQRTNRKYQTVMREWLAEGASKARRELSGS
ncbi:MAG: hypothetical protein AAF735_08340 [Myxococcota bacterium]